MMKEAIQTVQEMQNYYRKTYDKGALTTSLSGQEWEWLKPFLPASDVLIEQNNSDLQILKKYWFSGNAVEKPVQVVMLERDIINIFIANSYELKKLIETTKFEYNPLDNVNATIITKHVSQDSKKYDEKSNRDITSDADTTTDTTTVHTGTDNLKDSYGEQSEIRSDNVVTNYGKLEKNSANTHSVSPIDTNEFFNESKDIGNETTATRTDNSDTTGSTTLEKHDDTHNRTVNLSDKVDGSVHQGVVDNDKFAREFNDITTSSYSDSVVRVGNIGVTSSQQLIAAEREISRFSVYERIKDIFVSNFCMMLYNDSTSYMNWGCEYGNYLL